MKYKLIVTSYDNPITGEYENVVNGLKQAEKLAEELRQTYVEEGDVKVSCYPIEENVKYPYEDYRVWVKDQYGDTYWRWVKVSEHGLRLYEYLK